MLLIIPIFLLVVRFQLDYLWLETLLLGGLLLASRFLKLSAKPPTWCAFLRSLSRKPAVACAIPAAASLIFRLALLPLIPAPHPVVPDEFSHSLLANTFLEGRLANPAHPLWPHFESIHILSQPTYSSMYLAGQASFLAIGKLLTGNLFGGVLLATMLFCAALTWFLQAYLPPGWALYGGMLAAIRIGASSYWNNSYWGGSVPAFGAALALGAFPRLIQTWRPLPMLAFTSGAIILANTRPYEGLGLLTTLCLAIVWKVMQEKRIPWHSFALGVGLSAILAGGAIWGMTRHWRAVTGNALEMPYALNQKTYGWPLTLPWFRTANVGYRNPQMEMYREFEQKEHDYITKPSQIPLGILLKADFLWRFYFGVLLSLTLLFAVPILRARRTRVLWIALAIVVCQVFIAQSGYPHYLSPAAPILILFLVQGIRHMMQAGQWLRPVAIGLMPVLAVLAIVNAVARPKHANPKEPNYVSWCCSDTRPRDRNSVVDQLAKEPGRQLVLVSYELAAYDTFEWVYNGPDIDASKVVFARDLGDNGKLFAYYKDRTFWRVKVKDGEGRLSRLPGPDRNLTAHTPAVRPSDHTASGTRD